MSSRTFTDLFFDLPRRGAWRCGDLRGVLDEAVELRDVEPVVAENSGHLVVDLCNGQAELAGLTAPPDRLEVVEIGKAEVHVALGVGRGRHADEHVGPLGMLPAVGTHQRPEIKLRLVDLPGGFMPKQGL
jgi:hypothetical protein